MILCIETSGEMCSIALVQKAMQAVVAEINEPNAHSKWLMPLIDKTLKENGLAPKDLKAIALSSGPGSYTGLRIGSAAAKSICMALDIPLVTVSTLEILARAMKAQKPDTEVFVPLLDARRMEVYTAVFDRNLNRLTDDIPHILSEETPALWQSQQAVLAGSGAEKTYKFLENKGLQLTYLQGVYPSAKHIAAPALDKFQRQKFTDLINFEPAYLKPFYTTAKPKQNP